MSVWNPRNRIGEWKSPRGPFGTKTMAYYRGWTYYESGLREPDDFNPYKPGDKRRSEWLAGYLDARAHFRLGHIFERYGVALND